MVKQISDFVTKSPAAAADLLLIRDVTSNTEKKTPVSGISEAVAASLPALSIAGSTLANNAVVPSKLDPSTSYVAVRQNAANIAQGTPSGFNTIYNAMPDISGDLVSGFTYKISIESGVVDLGGTNFGELVIRLDSASGATIAQSVTSTSKAGQYGYVHCEGFFTATSTGRKTFAFCLSLNGTGVMNAAQTKAYIEFAGKPANGL